MNLPPFKLERFFSKHEFTAKFILCASDCETLSVQELLGFEPTAAEQLEQLRLGYTETQGNPTLRKEIARMYTTISSDEILVHSGGEEAIVLLLYALLDPGDHVIVHTPCYQSLMEIPRSIGCEVAEWNELAPDGVTVENLTKSIRSNTKAIILNTPHNPTGSQLSIEDLRKIAQVAHEKGIVLFSDEAYRESEYEANDSLPAACDLTDTAVSMGVLSKAYGLPGLRIGWLATHNHHLLTRVMQLKDYTTICSSAPSEFLAEVALRNRMSILTRNRMVLKNNVRLLDEFFSRHGKQFEWRRPKAGPVAFPRLLNGEADTFCDRLLAKTGVLLLPGSIYGDYPQHVRIGFGRTIVPEALRRLEDFLRS